METTISNQIDLESVKCLAGFLSENSLSFQIEQNNFEYKIFFQFGLRPYFATFSSMDFLILGEDAKIRLFVDISLLRPSEINPKDKNMITRYFGLKRPENKSDTKSIPRPYLLDVIKGFPFQADEVVMNRVSGIRNVIEVAYWKAPQGYTFKSSGNPCRQESLVFFKIVDVTKLKAAQKELIARRFYEANGTFEVDRTVSYVRETYVCVIVKNKAGELSFVFVDFIDDKIFLRNDLGLRIVGNLTQFASME